MFTDINLTYGINCALPSTTPDDATSFQFLHFFTFNKSIFFFYLIIFRQTSDIWDGYGTFFDAKLSKIDINCSLL
jgi:hypothetical protein